MNKTDSKKNNALKRYDNRKAILTLLRIDCQK